MAREKQVAFKSVLSAFKTAGTCLKEGKITKEGVTAQMADQLGLSVEQLETRLKTFAQQKKYRPIFEKIGDIPYQVVGTGTPGRQGMSEDEVNAAANELEDIFG